MAAVPPPWGSPRPNLASLRFILFVLTLLTNAGSDLLCLTLLTLTLHYRGVFLRI
jgi:hypothetical protein